MHIPRTGGRFLTKLFRENNYDVKFNYFYTIKTKNKEIEMPHLAYPDYTLLFEGTANCFTIIRDPVSRFQSLLKKHVSDLDKIFYSKNNFVNYVSKQIISSNCNWFLPQVNFITKNTFLWKFENNLDKDFFNWLYKNFGFYFEKKDVIYDKSEKVDKEEVILNKKQVNFIKEYYYQDYKILDY